MPFRIAALLLFLTLFPRRAIAHHTADTHDRHTVYRRAVTNTSKAGLAWPNGNSIDINQYLSTGKVQWYYTWGPSSIQSNIEFVPQLWGTKQLSQWDSSINDTIRSLNVTHALGFNEPEISGQAAQGTGYPARLPGAEQLTSWMSACGGGCTIDFVAVHYYDINSTGFVEYLIDYHDTFQKPVWVTEWACQNYNNANEQCSQRDVVDFMNATQQFTDETDWLERYAWFGAMEDMQGVNSADALMSSGGKINQLGEQYIGMVAANVSPDYQPGIVHGGSGNSSPNGGRHTDVPDMALHTFFVLGVLVMVGATLT
ncbi:glycosyl hydrolase catalytic core-domain-containing protein [Dichomitus squalens]|uniref:Glycosyl hydrolase catalytic core-domain-containing protein n=1 Tax=Dichomitus squalens TaxID=114155 RepID=A0A4Q9MZM6_9APHY|nr:glycosyl hydrolase catalytic core-domain-containing protein [Dichomitus squalens]